MWKRGRAETPKKNHQLIYEPSLGSPLPAFPLSSYCRDWLTRLEFLQSVDIDYDFHNDQTAVIINHTGICNTISPKRSIKRSITSIFVVERSMIDDFHVLRLVDTTNREAKAAN